MVRAFAHGAMGRRIDPSWGGPIELFLVPASAPRLAASFPSYVCDPFTSAARCSPVVRSFAHCAMGRWIGLSWWTY